MMKSSKRSANRSILTDEQLKGISARDLSKVHLTDDERLRLRKIIEERNERIELRATLMEIEEEPIIADLRKVGWNVSSVWDLVSVSKNYSEAIPVLLHHLLLPYSDKIREGIARDLAVPDARHAWPILVSEYKKAPQGWDFKVKGDPEKLKLGAKNGLACALAATVSNTTMPELIDIVRDATHGESRLILLPALHKSKNPLAKQALVDLATDPDLAIEIASWRKR